MQLASPLRVTSEQPAILTTESGSLGMVVCAAVLGLLLLLTLRHPDAWGVNDQSRWNTVYSLGEHGTYQIDDAPWLQTVDKVHINGHFYSSKPPVLPTLVAGEYIALKKLTGGALSLGQETPMGAHLNHATEVLTGYRGRIATVIPALLILTNLIPFALYLWLFTCLTERLSSSIWVRSFTMMAVALGTFITSFQVTLNNHTTGALCFFFAIYQAYRILCEGRREGWRFAVAGFSASFAAVVELSAVIIPPLLLLAFVCTCRWRAVRWFVPFALLPFVAHFSMNYLVTGGWLPVYANKAAYLYPGSPWSLNQAGNLTILDDSLECAWESWPVHIFHNLFGHHGWFTLTPVMLLAAAGVIRVAIHGQKWYRLLAISSVALLVYLLVIYTFFSGFRNYGGDCTGPRYLFWIIPAWLIFLPAGLDCIARHRALRGLALLLLMASVATVMHSAMRPWASSWPLDLLRQKGIITY